MPVYTWECTNERCKKLFDEARPVANRDLEATCPTCGKKGVRQMSRTSPPQFKCKGFYETDYKKAGK